MVEICAEKLLRMGACPEQCAKFLNVFGRCVHLKPKTLEENAELAVSSELNLNWATNNLLSRDARARWRKAIDRIAMVRVIMPKEEWVLFGKAYIAQERRKKARARRG